MEFMAAECATELELSPTILSIGSATASKGTELIISKRVTAVIVVFIHALGPYGVSG